MDMSQREAMQSMTMRHLADTQLALRELKHVQLLCDSYSKAQHSVFAATDPSDMPPVSSLLKCLFHQLTFKSKRHLMSGMRVYE